ncbi:transcription factor VIP1-like [Hibiscus syriacus]|uniref:Transcription factor VIP1-like n=1 Tax=Hibiscus syriacus TaxID=106335 RepID=A0A6A3D705_HIBSY|nr:transcription factor VIP1-like [Hibiscus syriacus]
MAMNQWVTFSSASMKKRYKAMDMEVLMRKQWFIYHVYIEIIIFIGFGATKLWLSNLSIDSKPEILALVTKYGARHVDDHVTPFHICIHCFLLISLINFTKSNGGYPCFMHNRQQRYGKVFKSFVLGRFTVFMTGREASKILLTGKDGMVSLNLFYTGQQVLGPNSLLQANGEAHKKLGRLIAEPLSIDGLKKYFHFINSRAIETLDRWSGRRVLVLEEASSVEYLVKSLELISSSFSSLPFKIPGTAFYNGIKVKYHSVSMSGYVSIRQSWELKRKNGVLYDRHDLGPNVSKSRDSMYAMLDSVIAKRRNGEVIQLDFLGFLIIKHSKGTNTVDDENKLTDQQMKDNILTLLVAGHDTTTAALTWLIKILGEIPAVLEELRVLGETLRRATILPCCSRKAAQDFEIDGYNIEKGWSISLDVVSIHHDPETFPDPEKFDPARFDAPLKTFSYLGFGSGPRMCPGMNLAKLEICIFIHHLVCRSSEELWRKMIQCRQR